MSDIACAERWIKAQLATRSALASVACRNAPVGDDFNGIVWKPYSFLGDEKPVGTLRILTVLEYEVVAVVDGENIGAARAWEHEIDAALENQVGSNPDGVIYECTRVRPVSFPRRTVHGKIRQTHGGVYRIVVKGA